MAEYLELEKVLDDNNIITVQTREYGSIEVITVDTITDIELADVQPVRRGEWIVDNDFYTCSRCNHQYLIDKILSMTIYPSGGMPYYCPCCGADMREPLKR